MPNYVRYALHMAVIFFLGFAISKLRIEYEWAWLFFLITWFTQYALLSPILRFKFWVRFIISFIFCGVSVFGSISCMVIIAFENHLKKGTFEVLTFTSYGLITILLYESFSSKGNWLGRTLRWLGRALKRMLRKMIDPHDQGIQ